MSLVGEASVDAGSFFSRNLIPARVTLKEGTSIEKMLPPDWPVGKPAVRSLKDHFGRAQLTIGRWT